LRHHRASSPIRRWCEIQEAPAAAYWKIINRAVPEALAFARLSRSDISEIEAMPFGHGSLSTRRRSMFHLKAKALTDEALAGESGIADRVRHKVRLHKWTFGETSCATP